MKRARNMAASSLVGALAALARRVAREIKARITAEHPGVVKAWVCFVSPQAFLPHKDGACGRSSRASAAVVRASHNVKSVRRLGKGRYRVNFARPLRDAHYGWLVSAHAHLGMPDAMTQMRTLAMAQITTAVVTHALTRTPQHLDLLCTTPCGALVDPQEVHLLVMR